MTKHPKPSFPAGPMPRRALLGLGAAATVAACGPSSDAGAGDGPAAPSVARRRTRQLRMVTTWPANFPGLGDMATRTAQMINDLSGGELDVRVYAAGELTGALGAFDAVATGAAQMYHGAEYYWQDKSPAFTLFTAVPMGLTAVEMMGWIDFGGGQALWEELSKSYGVIAFAAGNTGHQMGGWFKKEINSLEDFRGLRMRIPGLGGEVIRQLGGAAQVLPGAEIFPALQSGALDATEWVGPWNDLAFSLYQAAPYYYGPGFHEPGAMLSCGMNLSVWEELPEDHQRIIRMACAWANNVSLGEYQHQNALALETLRTEHGVQLRAFPDEVWPRVREISDDVLADIGARDDLSKRIYDSFMAAKRRAGPWARISEQPYLRVRDTGSTG